MPDKEFEEDDPYEFTAVRFPAEPGTDPDEIMTRTFVEEYALMGMPRYKLLQLFRSPHFVATHRVLEARGEGFVLAIIDDVYGGTAEPALEVL